MPFQSQKLTEIEAHIIAKILDDLISKYEQNNNYILQNPSERKSLLYEKDSLFPKTRPCIISGCKKRSIKNSHAIQKAHSLTLIAENKHLYTPFFSKKTGKIEMKRVGINEASTFPGFCPEHEKIFHRFENAKDVDSDDAITLQIFRTIARELIVKECELNSLIKTKETYLKFRQKKILNLLHEEIKKRLPPIETKIKSIKIDCVDSVLDTLNHKIEDISSDLSEFRTTFFDPLYRYIFLNTGQTLPLYIANLTVEDQIPVCLSGRANFSISDHGIKHDIVTIIDILPKQTETKLFLAVEPSHSKYLDVYIAEYLRTVLPRINMTETWMVRGSDHWFIKPSSWDEINAPRKQQILKDILDINFNIGTPYEYSIFNSLRKRVIEDYIKKTSSMDTEIKNMIDIELKKL